MRRAIGDLLRVLANLIDRRVMRPKHWRGHR